MQTYTHRHTNIESIDLPFLSPFLATKYAKQEDSGLQEYFIA